MRSKITALLAVLAIALALPACGSGGTSSASPSPTDPGQTAACDNTTVGTSTETGSASSTPEPSSSESPSPEPPDMEFPQDTVPDGHWHGPIVVSATGTPSNGGGSVFNPGGGYIDLVIADHEVKSGSVTFHASSTGTVVTPQGGTGTINASGVVSDGVPSGPASKIVIAGTMVESGSILVNVHGTQTTVPLNGSVEFTAALTVTEVSCHQVTATFLPDLNAKAAGGATFSGTAEWRGERV